MNGERHRQAAADEHRGVEGPERDVELVAGRRERVGIPEAVDRVDGEQPAEEQDFGEQEHPHPERRRFLLLVEVVEVVGERRMMRRVRASCVRQRASPRRWIVVRALGHDRRLREVLCRRRRRRLPLQAGRAPRVRAGRLAVPQRPDEIHHRQQIAHAENRRAGRRQHVQHLELRRIRVIPARHPEIAEQELREERQVEADEDDAAPTASPSPSGYMRPLIFGHQ